MMLRRVCVSVYVCVFGEGRGLEKGNKERQREKKEGAWGDKGIECETN